MKTMIAGVLFIAALGANAEDSSKVAVEIDRQTGELKRIFAPAPSAGATGGVVDGLGINGVPVSRGSSMLAMDRATESVQPAAEPVTQPQPAGADVSYGPRPVIAAALQVEPVGVVASPTPADAPDDESDPSNLDFIQPDSSGVVIFGQHKPSEGTQSMVNPFTVRVLPKLTSLDTKVKVGGVTKGRIWTATINGKTYATTDKFGLFNVHLIRRGYVVLEREGQFAKIPRNIEVTLRVPKPKEG